jgi:hypothetical protein
MDPRSYYKEIRQFTYAKSYEKCCEKWPDLKDRLQLREIDTDALLEIKDNWKQVLISGNYALTAKGWNQVASRFKRNHHSRLDLALWCDGYLCAVMLGKPSKKKLVLSLHFLDGDRDEGPLSGKRADICLLTAELYGLALSAHYVALRNPLPGAVPLYETLGYSEKKVFGAVDSALYKELPKV